MLTLLVLLANINKIIQLLPAVHVGLLVTASSFHTLAISLPPSFDFQVQESFVPLGGASGELGLAIGGGADYGEFPFVTAAHGGGATVGDIILEIGGTPVLGMTLGDVRGVLNSCPHPIRIKTVSPGQWTACPVLTDSLS